VSDVQNAGGRRICPRNHRMPLIAALTLVNLITWTRALHALHALLF
jgi:hypothetical protein